MGGQWCDWAEGAATASWSCEGFRAKAAVCRAALPIPEVCHASTHPPHRSGLPGPQPPLRGRRTVTQQGGRPACPTLLSQPPAVGMLLCGASAPEGSWRSRPHSHGCAHVGRPDPIPTPLPHLGPAFDPGVFAVCREGTHCGDLTGQQVHPSDEVVTRVRHNQVPGPWHEGEALGPICTKARLPGWAVSKARATRHARHL